MKQFDFSENAPVMKLDLLGNKNHAGEVSAGFKASKPFEFAGI